MIIYDLILLLLAALAIGEKSLYLGAVTLVIGLFIAFQNTRTHRLLGSKEATTSTTRKAKAAALAVILGLCALPLLLEAVPASVPTPSGWSEVTLLPLVVIVGLIAATLMSALAIEKRKR